MINLDDVKIETNRLLLREFKTEDWPSVHIYGSDPEVSKYMDWGPNSESDTKEYVKLTQTWRIEKPRQTFEVAIVLKEKQKLVGGCGLRIKSKSNREADFGYTLCRDYWGNGFATEAAKAILDFGFKDLKMHRIWATTAPDNIGSIKVLEKLGLKKEGLLRENLWAKGKWRDSYLYATLEQEYRAT
jgi:RimJ/RimL family protein N-acetyltransferase